MKAREISELEEGMLIGSGRRDKINAVFMITEIFKKKDSTIINFKVTRITPGSNQELYKKDPRPSSLERREETVVTEMELLTPRIRKMNDD
tara:strand:- start:704 stop:976 length:273 start_codon:yes stop_codon:yes gene_type:complete